MPWCGFPEEKENETVEKQAKEQQSFFLLAAGIWILSLHRTEEFSITCLDVGQGDGIVLETPEKYCFLVDGGSSGQKTVGKRQILPYLKCKGISRVDGILISHTDGDHISGIREILELSGKGLSTIEIGALYLPDWTEPPDAWLELKKLAHEAGISVFTLGEKQCLRAGRLSLEVLSPSKGSSGQDVNEDCMVLEVRYGEFLGFFTGDMGEETEKELLKENVLQDVEFFEGGTPWLPLFYLPGVSGKNQTGIQCDLLFREQYLWTSFFGNCRKAGKCRKPGCFYHEKRGCYHFYRRKEYPHGRVSEGSRIKISFPREDFVVWFKESLKADRKATAFMSK